MFCQNKGLSFSLSRLGAIVVTVIMCHRIINLKDVTSASSQYLQMAEVLSLETLKLK